MSQNQPLANVNVGQNYKSKMFGVVSASVKTTKKMSTIDHSSQQKIAEHNVENHSHSGQSEQKYASEKSAKKTSKKGSSELNSINNQLKVIEKLLELYT